MKRRKTLSHQSEGRRLGAGIAGCPQQRRQGSEAGSTKGAAHGDIRRDDLPAGVDSGAQVDATAQDRKVLKKANYQCATVRARTYTRARVRPRRS